MRNKITLVNLYKDIVLSDPYLYFLYNIVYQQHIKIVIQIHAFLIYHLPNQTIFSQLKHTYPTKGCIF